MCQTTFSQLTAASNSNYTFAKQKFADALLVILSAKNINEGLYSACIESFAQIDPKVDLPSSVSTRFHETMLRIGCEFNTHEQTKLRKALSSLDSQSVNNIVDELRLLATVLSLHDMKHH